jgi:putative heme-binding domain-containing protein
VVALSYVGGYEAQRIVEEVVTSPSRPLALRQAAVLAFPRIAGGGAPPVQPGQPPYQFGDRRLLQLVQSGALPADLHESAAGVLYRSPRADVRQGVAQTSLAPPSTRTADGRVLPPAAELAARTGDAALGRAAFDRACAICHQVQGRGVDFGPPLTEIGSKLPKEALYTAILEPNQGVAFNYEGATVRMRDGREVTGIIVDNTATEVAVKVIGGVTTRYPKTDVALVLPMDASLMPDGLESALTEAELVGVVEYMAGLRTAGTRE